MLSVDRLGFEQQLKERLVKECLDLFVSPPHVCAGRMFWTVELDDSRVVFRGHA